MGYLPIVAVPHLLLNPTDYERTESERTIRHSRELRHLTAYLSGVAGFAAREKCAKLTQVVCILNVETMEEAKEVRVGDQFAITSLLWELQ